MTLRTLLITSTALSLMAGTLHAQPAPAPQPGETPEQKQHAPGQKQAPQGQPPSKQLPPAAQGQPPAKQLPPAAQGQPHTPPGAPGQRPSVAQEPPKQEPPKQLPKAVQQPPATPPGAPAPARPAQTQTPPQPPAAQAPAPGTPQRPAAQGQPAPGTPPQRPAAQGQPAPGTPPQHPAAKELPKGTQQPAQQPAQTQPPHPVPPAAQTKPGTPQPPAAQTTPPAPAAQGVPPAPAAQGQPQTPGRVGIGVGGAPPPAAQGQPQTPAGRVGGAPPAPPAQAPAAQGQPNPQQPNQPGRVGVGAPPAQAPAAQAPVGQAPGTQPLQPAAQGQPPRPIPPAAQGQPIQLPGTNARSVEQLRGERREVRDGNRTLIQEGDRVIVREGNQTIIRHNEVDRFRYGARDVRVDRRGNETTTVIERPDGVRIVTVTDESGRLLRRVRQDGGGREFVLIDNHYSGPGSDRASYFVDLPPPAIRIPRERYIVEAEHANEADFYAVFTAPPVEQLSRRYTLDEIRYSPQVRDRMPRVDIDTINFETGSWEVSPDQAARLSVIAAAINQAIAKNPAEMFLIEGHTDAVGADVDNLSLSDRRAETVALVLTQQFQVPAENLTTQGYGEQYLKIQTEAAERQNRRVTMRRITPLLAGNNGQGG